MKHRTRRIRQVISLVLTIALAVPMMALSVPVAHAADVEFAGGPILGDMPTLIPNDHTPLALRFSAVDVAEDALPALLPSTTYEIKIRLAPSPTPSNVQNRGYVWNGSQWTFNRGPSWGEGNFPTVTTDASGNIAESPWVFFKFGNEIDSGSYYILVSLNSGTEGTTRNATMKPMVTVVDMETEGTRVHNGAESATTAQDARRVVVASSESTDNANSILSIMRTENNIVDDDDNGVIDDEDYGQSGDLGDYLLTAWAESTIDVWVQQNKRVDDAALGGPDEDIALGAAEMSAPTSPTALAAVADDTSITLTWDAATDDTGVTGYRVYRWTDVSDVVFTPVHELIGTTTGLTFVDDAVPMAGTTYNYEVRAHDAATNVSARSATASAMLTNAAPVAADDDYLVSEDSTLTVSAQDGVLANDSDANGDAITAVLWADPSFGAINLAPNGSFTYVPNAGFYGTDSFSYVAADALADSAPATVTLTVVPVVDGIEVAGPTRVETAIEASKLAFPLGAEYVIIATARNWPDALGGSSLAGALGAPILLTEPGVLSPLVIDEIGRLGATTAIILGGTGAVSQAVEDDLVDLLGGDYVERIFGDNRYETADAVAAATLEIMWDVWDGTAFVATGEDFPDALGASPLAARNGWPIYLDSPRAGSDTTLIETMEADGVTRVVILGGSGAVPTELETALDAAFGADSVERLFGDTRYDTAVAVAEFGVLEANLDWDTVALATGQDFPDALAGGVLQGRNSSVLLLTHTAYLDDVVGTTLTDHKAGIVEVRFLGGTGAVSQTVRDAVLALLD